MALYIINVFVSIFENNNEALMRGLCMHCQNSYSAAGLKGTSTAKEWKYLKYQITETYGYCLGMFLLIFLSVQPKSQLHNFFLGHHDTDSLAATQLFFVTSSSSRSLLRWLNQMFKWLSISLTILSVLWYSKEMSLCICW